VGKVGGGEETTGVTDRRRRRSRRGPPQPWRGPGSSMHGWGINTVLNNPITQLHSEYDFYIPCRRSNTTFTAHQRGTWALLCIGVNTHTTSMAVSQKILHKTIRCARDARAAVRGFGPAEIQTPATGPQIVQLDEFSVAAAGRRPRCCIGMVAQCCFQSCECRIFLEPLMSQEIMVFAQYVCAQDTAVPDESALHHCDRHDTTEKDAMCSV